MSDDEPTIYNGVYGRRLPGPSEETTSFLCPPNHFPGDAWAIKMAQTAGYREVDRADFTESEEWDVLLDKDGERWKLVPFLPSGDPDQGVEMFFRADGRWIAFLRRADHEERVRVTIPAGAIISQSFSGTS